MFMTRQAYPALMNNQPTAMSRRRSWDMVRCLVTGGSSGLGQALAEQLVRAGAQVVLTGRSAERLQAIADRLIGEGCDPSRIVTIPADLTVEEDCQRLFDEIAGRFEALDLVINSAGAARTDSSRPMTRRCFGRSSRSTYSHWRRFAAELCLSFRMVFNQRW